MWRDLIHGLRLLAAAPALSAVVVASLAIGIGVNVAVFSWVQVFALTPLPGVPRAAEFHLIEPRGDAGAYPGASWQEYQDLRAGLAGVAQAIAFRMAPFSVGEANQTERAFGAAGVGGLLLERSGCGRCPAACSGPATSPARAP